jgi:hypothetical protein
MWKGFLKIVLISVNNWIVMVYLTVRFMQNTNFEKLFKFKQFVVAIIFPPAVPHQWFGGSALRR